MTIVYKVRFGSEPSKNKIPLSIVRKMEGEDTFVVESCNKYRGWTSSPDGEDMPIEIIKKWINQWKKNW